MSHCCLFRLLYLVSLINVTYISLCCNTLSYSILLFKERSSKFYRYIHGIAHTHARVLFSAYCGPSVSIPGGSKVLEVLLFLVPRKCDNIARFIYFFFFFRFIISSSFHFPDESFRRLWLSFFHKARMKLMYCARRNVI